MAETNDAIKESEKNNNEGNNTSGSTDNGNTGSSGVNSTIRKSDINLGNKDFFVGYSENDTNGCHRRCVNILTNYGLKSYGDMNHVFKLLYEKDNKLHYFGSDPKQNYANAISCIDRHLEAGRPIIVGVTHTIGKGINEGATDHFVTIYGRVYGEDGYMYYMYYEVGRSSVSVGLDDLNNRFKYDPDEPSFYDGRSKIYNGARFDVTQVRPNDDDNRGTVSQYAVDRNVENLQDFIYKPSSTTWVENDNSSNNNNSLYSNIVTGLWNVFNGGGSSSNSYGNGSTSTSSFGLDKIFGSVFPNDDNNRYIDMPTDDIMAIQYTEPILKIDKINISGKSYASMGIQPNKIAFYVPVVYVNDFLIPQTNITNFYLDYSSFMPQVMVEFVDMTNELLSTNIPKPGSYIKVYVGGNGDENYYKPIRQDFIITNIIKTNKTGGDYQNLRNPLKYKISGILNVPLGFRKTTWSSSEINARQAMFNMSNLLGLGFATNYNTNSTVDVMRWVNTQNKSYCDFLKEISQHSVYSPYTFFTSFIDQYYVLNYIECRRLLSHGGNKTDTPQMIYNCILPEIDEKKSKKTDDDLGNGDQRLSYYFISNSLEFKGWTNYIEEYYEINDGYALLSDGYRKTVTYSDKSGFINLFSKNYNFLLTPIDNLYRDVNTKNIMLLPTNVNYDTYIPLNLRQTTNPAYFESQKIYDDPAAAESAVDLGEVDTSNNFPLYFYAPLQNEFQMKNLKKCGLCVRLQNYNPSITKFSRIWVDIYDMHRNSTTQIRENPRVEKLPESKAKDYLLKKNRNIIIFDNETTKDTEEQSFNRSLSGWYVVTEMKIIYNTVKDFKGKTKKKLQTQLVLNRIEYKPTFHTEYEMARKAIEKYSIDNIAENIMRGGDTM